MRERFGRRLTGAMVAGASSLALSLALVGCVTPTGVVAPSIITKESMPNLSFLTLADARQLLSFDGYKVGEVTYAYDDTMPSGVVISQSPEAEASVDKGAEVSMVISRGKEDAELVSVPGLNGLTQDEAVQTLLEAQLVPVPGTPMHSNTATPGTVCLQSMTVGAQVPAGTMISFDVALGRRSATVPDLQGMAVDDAVNELKSARLGVDRAYAYSDDVAEGNVIGQSILAGTDVIEGTTVVMRVSLGAKADTVKMAEMRGYTLEDALYFLESAGLPAVYSGDLTGSVRAQDVECCTDIKADTTVRFVLQDYTTLTQVPNVAGLLGTDALAVMQQAGLAFDYDTSDPEHQVMGTTPEVGTLVSAGTLITAVYPEGTGQGDKSDDAVGTWTINSDATSVVSSEERAIFDQVASNNLREPIAVLATQLVSGTNYAFLCKSDDDWSVVTVYCDLKGNAQLLADNLIDLSAIKTVDASDSEASSTMVGSWAVAAAPKVTLQPSEAQKAFDEAFASYNGIAVDPLATLATQLVSGTNYRIIGVNTVDPRSIYVVTVYAPLDGKAEVTEVEGFDLLSYVS